MITYPAFTDGYFKTTMDGEIHFIKMDAITTTLKSGSLPPLVNFAGYFNTGMAFNGMYPWIASLIFIIPKMIIGKPITALVIGFVCLNMLTMVNTYLLARKLVSSLAWRLLGVFIYELNIYHLTVMYGRNAIGEMLAYAFLPLVFLGCIQIWQDDKWGIVPLGLGMGMIANSHVISILYTTLIIVTAESYRLCKKRLSLKEIQRFVLAGMIAFLVSCCSLVNIGYLMLKNEMITPWKQLLTIDPVLMWEGTLRNTISDLGPRNLGLVTFAILLLMGSQLFKNKSGSWRVWIISAFIVLILLSSWIPYSDSLKKSFLGNLQFVGRLYTYVIIFLIIGLLMYLENNTVELSAKNCLIIATSLLILFGISGIVDFHKTKGDDPIRYYLTNSNYFQELSQGKDGWYDYMVTVNGKWAVDLKNLDGNFVKDSHVVSVNNKMITFEFETKKSNHVKLPFVLYRGVDYQVTVNGKQVNNFEKDQALSIVTKKGKNQVTVTSKAPKFTYVTFIVSILSIMVSSILLMKYIYTGNKKILV